MGQNSYEFNGRFEKDEAVGICSIHYSNGDLFKG